MSRLCRRKGFYCLAVNLLDLQALKTVMERITDEAEPKAVVRLFEETAAENGVSLKLRK
jgi:hypothetical protein